MSIATAWINETGAPTGNAPLVDGVDRHDVRRRRPDRDAYVAMLEHKAHSPEELKSIGWNSFVPRIRPGVDEPAVVPFNSKRRENAGAVGARVNSDPIWMILDFGRDGVAVNDHEAVVGLVKKERLANPTKVGLALLIEVDARPDAGMDKEIIAETAAINEALEELDVIFRNHAANDGQRLLVTQMRELLGLYTVALQAFGAAEPPPFRDQLGLTAQNSQQHFFVIAQNEDRSNAFASVSA